MSTTDNEFWFSKRASGLAALSCRVLLVTCAAGAMGCSGDETKISSRESALKLDPEFEGDPTEPARDYTLFEADPVRPVAVLARSGLVAVTNTVDDRLELFTSRGSWRGPPRDQGHHGGHGTEGDLRHCESVHVGMRPVAVAVVRDTPRLAELWIANHLSDSISVVQVHPSSCKSQLVDTLHVGDEPRDLVVSETSSGAPLVFLTTAHRGQHHPVESARSGRDLVTAPGQKTHKGMADVFVFDPRDRSSPVSVINLFTDTPRALAVADGTVYAAGFHTGNQTTIIPAETAQARGRQSLLALLAVDDNGNIVERDGQLVLKADAIDNATIQGGQAAVVGRGRCLSDPRGNPTEAFTLEVCVATDDQHKVQAAYLEEPGRVNSACQCTSGDGTLQPSTGVIVQFFEGADACGAALQAFPDGREGCWLDAAPGGVKTPAKRAASQSPPLEWNQQVKLSLPDEDVFAIDVDDLSVTRAYAHVGTVLFSMAAQPNTGRVFVLGTEAHNLTRFEGPGEYASTTVRGHLHESRISILDPSGTVTPVHLNDHIDYAKCCERDPRVAEKSLALPTSGVFTADGATLYATALGSDKVFALDTDHFDANFENASARKRGHLRELYAGADPTQPSGPVGLSLSSDEKRLYVKTHLSNELLVLDARNGRLIQRVALASPEPESIVRGRHLLYNARLTSAHGDSACASCHVFGNFDGLSWDLGDPDAPTVKNPGPYATPPEVNSILEIALDPNAPALTPDFRSNKGPMSTQTLRGMANHGAQHWRGDRTRNFQHQPGAHPNSGALNEDNSFGEFDVAVVGLNGNDQLLPQDTFQEFTNFALQITLPPNPIRNLDDSLTEEQAAGRATFFGCASQTQRQYDARRCTSPSGRVVDVDQEAIDCACSASFYVRVADATLESLPAVLALQEVLLTESNRDELVEIAGLTEGITGPALPTHARLVEEFAAALEAFSEAQLAVDQKNLVPERGALTLGQGTGAFLSLLTFFEAQGVATGGVLSTHLLGLLPADISSEFSTPEGLAGALEELFLMANVTVRVQRDEAARGTSDFRNLLLDCSVGTPKSCDARMTDTLQTCHGCHTLDPAGNSEFEVYRPGFFGSDGRYSFENESQIMKVPHLRNLYQKAGMFGRPPSSFNLPESLFGPTTGGFFAEEHQDQGPQIRGSGFMHDGAMDTTHRFLGAVVFAARPEGQFTRFDAGNPRALEPVFPKASTRAACVETFRNADLSVLPPLPDDLLQALEFCSAASGLPDVCFLDPESTVCQRTLERFGAVLQIPNLSQLFETQILPACYQLGSTLEGGQSGGACYPEGLTEQAELEAFLMAFDTNLKPMVGQQTTLHGSGVDRNLTQSLVEAADRRDCDIVASAGNRDYVMVDPRPRAPLLSLIQPVRGATRTLLSLVRRRSVPVTLTCYPPQPGRAEAFRFAR